MEVVENLARCSAMKKLPVFKNEDEERDFWAKHDLGDVFDESKGQVVTFPNLKPSKYKLPKNTK